MEASTDSTSSSTATLVTLETITLGGLTASRAAWFLAVYPKSAFAAGLHDALTSAVASELESFGGRLPCVALPSAPRRDPRPALDESVYSLPVHVYTDYALVRDSYVADGAAEVEFVASKDDASFLLLISHIKDFFALPENVRVSQFPYEGGFVRKDLLPLTVRRYCYSPAGQPPSWWLPCFDLSTELHFFLASIPSPLSRSAELERRSADTGLDALDNCWIAKPAQGARGQGHELLLGAAVARDACALAGGGDGDRVAQLLVTRPLTVLGRKFDLRVVVIVRSFAPVFEAYMHTQLYARLANRPYSPATMGDHEVTLTTATAYSGQQMRLSAAALEDALGREQPGMNWAALISAVHQMCGELFGGLAPVVGEWPRSAGYYCLDVVLDTAAGPPAPRLLEVNFCGDLHALELAAPDQFADFMRDLMQALATRVAPNPARMLRLAPPA